MGNHESREEIRQSVRHAFHRGDRRSGRRSGDRTSTNVMGQQDTYVARPSDDRRRSLDARQATERTEMRNRHDIEIAYADNPQSRTMLRRQERSRENLRATHREEHRLLRAESQPAAPAYRQERGSGDAPSYRTEDYRASQDTRYQNNGEGSYNNNNQGYYDNQGNITGGGFYQDQSGYGGSNN